MEWNVIANHDQYADLTAQTIVMLENIPGTTTFSVEDIGDHMATIAFGYTFNRDENLSIFQASGITLSAADITALRKIDTAANANKTNTALNEWKKVLTLAEAQQLLAASIFIYEQRVDAWLAGAVNIPESSERAALVSLSYNGIINAGVSNGLRNAIIADDRAEAWYEIRYNSNGGAYQQGTANRRYVEAEMFGLYDDHGADPSATSDEAANVAMMYARYRDSKITAYEQNYTPQESENNYNGVQGINGILEELKPAIAKLKEDYGLAATVQIEEVLMASASNVPAKNKLNLNGEGSTGNSAANDQDLLIGSNHDNVLNGGAGDDVLIGMGGADTLNGGAGVDTVSYVKEAMPNNHFGDLRDFELTINATSITALNRGTGDVDQISNVEKIVLGGGSDTVKVNAINPTGDGLSIDGGAQTHDGKDVIDFSAIASGVAIGNGIVTSRTGNDQIRFVNFETVIGTGHADVYQNNSSAYALVDLGSGDDTVTSAASGTLIDLGSGGADIVFAKVGTNIGIKNFGAEDLLKLGDRELHGGTKSMVSESPWVTNLGGQVRYGLNMVGDLVVSIAGIGGPGVFILGWASSYGSEGNANYVGNGNIVLAKFQINAVGLLEDWSGKGSYWATWELFGLKAKSLTGTNAWGGQDPIVFDLDADGIELSNLSSVAPMFDVDADLYYERIGWVGRDDGLLVRDAGKDGVIGDSRELFGGRESGFAVLATLDGNGDGVVNAADDGLVDFNADGIIDATDAFADLQIWRDLDQDGKADDGELEALSEYDIVGINIAATPSSQMVAGNQIVATSTFIRGDGTTGQIGEAILKVDNSRTQYAGAAITISADAEARPDLKGYGTLVSLREALSLTPSGLTQVDQALAALDVTEHTPAELRSAIKPILDAWVDGSPIRDANGAITYGQGTLEAYEDLVVLRRNGEIVDYVYATEGAAWQVDGEPVAVSVTKFASGHTVALTAPADFFDLTAAWGSIVDSSTAWVVINGVNTAVTDHEYANGEHAYNIGVAYKHYADGPGDTYAWDTIDGKELAFFERYLGEVLPFRIQPSSRAAGVELLNEALTTMEGTLDLIALRFAVQSGAFASVFEGIAYNVEEDNFYATTDLQLAHTFANLLELSKEQIDPLAWLEEWKPIVELLIGDFDRGEVDVMTNGFLVKNLVAAYEMAQPAFSLDDAADALGDLGGNILIGSGAVSGTDGADIFYLHEGDQTVSGGAELDNYIVGSNFGNDVIDEVDSTLNPHREDLVRFATINSDEITASRDGIDLVITVTATGDTLRIKNHFLGEDYRLLFGTTLFDEKGVATIEFANGEVWDKFDIAKAVSRVDAASTTVSGTEDNDYLDGGAGQDTLVGGGDADIYVFGRGYGQDVISDHESNLERMPYLDILKFEAGITIDDLVFTREPFDFDWSTEGHNDLLISIKDTTDSILIKSQFHGLADVIFYGDMWTDQIELFAFSNGTMFTPDDIRQILLAQSATDGDDQIDGFEVSDDVIDGGKGDDTLQGNHGDDTYLYGLNDGNDLIRDLGTDGLQYDSDTVQFKEDIEFADLHIERSGTWLADATLTFGSAGNSLKIINQFGSISMSVPNPDGSTSLVLLKEMANFRFADGTTLTATQLRQHYILQESTSGNDTVDGFMGADTINSGEGDDVIRGYDGRDTYVFDENFGNDILDDGWNEGDGLGEANTIVFAAEYTSTDLRVARSGEDIILGFEGRSDTLTRKYTFGRFDDYQFGDGVTLTGDQLLERHLDQMATSGDDVIQGFNGDDVVRGKEGDDTLEGLFGHNTLIGGSGDDVYLVLGDTFVDTDDTVVELENEGTDTAIARGNYTLAAHVENLILANDAHPNDDDQYPAYRGTGNGLANVITGNDASNTLDGAGGADTLIGGGSDDTYVVDDLGDVVVETGEFEFDTVRSSVNGYALTDLVEALVLVGEADIGGSGNSMDNSLTGNSGSNLLQGLGGNDQFFSSGGTDTFAGGEGDDHYVVENAATVIVEHDGEGQDSVYATVSYTLASHVESLVLGGDADINGIGGDTDNRLIGNDGNNSLSGAGGNDWLDGDGGIDVLSGGLGDDTFIINDADDTVVELVDEGIDVVLSTVTYTLGANVEDLVLQGFEAIDGTGNARDNYLTGNESDNVLSGADGNDVLNGGGGMDLLRGGEGDDTYRIDSVETLVEELSGEGIDSVESTVSHTLSENVENLTLRETSIPIPGGEGPLPPGGGFPPLPGIILSGTGNALDNVITGNSGRNRLDGQAGNDTLSGGAGNDDITGGSGNDVLSGGGGEDEASFSGVLADYQITRNVDGSITVTDLVGSDGMDRLTGVEYAFFEGDESSIELAEYLAVDGTAGNDTLIGTAGSDNLYGLDGDDSLEGGDGGDLLDGGDGNDVAALSGLAGDYLVQRDFTGLVRVTSTSGDVDRLASVESVTFLGDNSNLAIDLLAGDYGTSGNDAMLEGTDGDDNLYGLDGDDVLWAKAGNDLIDGGDGIDQAEYALSAADYRFDRQFDGAVLVTALAGSEGMDQLRGVEKVHFIGDSSIIDLSALVADYGTEGDDSFLGGTSGSDNIYGLGGDDVLSGGSGNDTLDGGFGRDEAVYAGNQADFAIGRNGDGTFTVTDLVSGEGTDWLIDVESIYFAGSATSIDLTQFVQEFWGSEFDDQLDGSSGRDILYGFEGNDILVGHEGDDTLAGGDGADEAWFNGSFSDYSLSQNPDGTISITDMFGFDGIDVLDGIETLYFFGDATAVSVEDALALSNGGARDVFGTAEMDWLDGSQWNDNLYGLEGNDTLIGNGGNDAIDGGDGVDNARYSGSLADYTLTQNTDGRVTITALVGGDGTDVLSNVENLYFYGDGTAISVLDAVAFSNGGTVAITGTTGADVLVGNLVADHIQGLGGNDTLTGGGGNDLIEGGDGTDEVRYGGVLTDYLFNENTDGTVTVVDLANDNGTDTLIGVETIRFGSASPMQLTDVVDATTGLGLETQGTSGNDFLFGTEWRDHLRGLAGNDFIAGFAGNDLIDGGDGADTVEYARAPTDYSYVLASDGGVIVTDLSGPSGTDTLNGVEYLHFDTGMVTLSIGQALTLYGQTGYGANPTIGTAGNDVIIAGNAIDTIDGAGGNDSIGSYYWQAGEVVEGGLGTDTLVAAGDLSEATISGFEHLQIIQGSYQVKATPAQLAGFAHIGHVDWYGSGTSRGSLQLVGSGTVDFSVSASDALAIYASTAGNAVAGTAFADTLTGDVGNDTLNGFGENDSISGGVGSDSLQGGDGNDALDGGAASDTLDGGSGADTLLGGDGADSLLGGADDDLLDGQAGSDQMSGGSGNDLYFVDNESDLAMELADQGADTVVSAVSFTIGANVENLTLTGTGNLTGIGNGLANAILGNLGDNTISGGDGADSLTGDGGNDSLLGGSRWDTIRGGEGNDVLDGGLDNDQMYGGLGDDLYFVDHVGDRVYELLNEGSDTVVSSISWSLSADVETLTLTGTANLTGTGNGLNNLIFGNGGADTLSGGNGNDTLEGNAGADSLDGGGNNDVLLGGVRWDTLVGGDGSDTLDGGQDNDQMYGGLGNDVYYVDHIGDRVNESTSVNEGSDTVYASITWNFTANIEAAVFTGTDHTASIGNSLANTLTGNAGNNTFAGGTGHDTIYGLDGNDSLDGGIDSDVLEGGAGNDVLLGGQRWDTLIGGEGNDVLDGGTENDRMLGNAGNDTYYVDHIGDRVIELTGEGVDTVLSSIDFALSADVEHLVLIDAAVLGTGNGLSNSITGNAFGNNLAGGNGNDTLSGGVGSDTLVGGNGVDDFVFSSAASNGTDTVSDFQHAYDRLVFSAADYGFAAGHSLTNAQFTSGSSALGAQAQFVWDASGRHLYWDADGAGAGAAVDLAVFMGTSTVSAEDLEFV